MQKIYITKKFSFDAAHKLVGYKGKCKNLHGHTYYLEVTVGGNINKKTGMVIDFHLLEDIINKQIISLLDHTFINNIIKMSTAENISQWVWNKLEVHLRQHEIKLYEIKLYESPDAFVTLKRNTD